MRIVEVVALTPLDQSDVTWHWTLETVIANPMSVYPEYRDRRSSWGVHALGAFAVRVTLDDGSEGVGVGFGGHVGCELVERQLRGLLLGRPLTTVADIDDAWERMYRSTLHYGGGGLVLGAISGIDLALWDALGHSQSTPVHRLLGEPVRDVVRCYGTAPLATRPRDAGFIHAKIPLPYGPGSGDEGLRQNVTTIAEARESVGPSYGVAIDCFMACDLDYALQLMKLTADLDVLWWEELLQPGRPGDYRRLRDAAGSALLTCGEHEFGPSGLGQMVEGRIVDIIQPELTYSGGLTAALRLAGQAASHGVDVVPHNSPFSFHFSAMVENCPFAETIFYSPLGDSPGAIFGSLLCCEPVPTTGTFIVPELPGFGLSLRDDIEWKASAGPRSGKS